METSAEPIGTSTDRLAARPVAATTSARSRADFEAGAGPHYAALVRRLVLVLGNVADAEDVAQEAYLRAFRAWDRFDGRDVRGWLFTIALRLAFNELRRRRRSLARLVRGEPEPGPWHDQNDPDLWSALGVLDGRTRAAVLLNVVDGYSQREVAEILGVPEGTVASWISRGRSRLRQALEDR